MYSRNGFSLDFIRFVGVSHQYSSTYRLIFGKFLIFWKLYVFQHTTFSNFRFYKFLAFLKTSEVFFVSEILWVVQFVTFSKIYSFTYEYIARKQPKHAALSLSGRTRALSRAGLVQIRLHCYGFLSNKQDLRIVCSAVFVVLILMNFTRMLAFRYVLCNYRLYVDLRLWYLLCRWTHTLYTFIYIFYRNLQNSTERRILKWTGCASVFFVFN
jgi:hypothetical protein